MKPGNLCGTPRKVPIPAVKKYRKIGICSFHVPPARSVFYFFLRAVCKIKNLERTNSNERTRFYL